MILLQTLWQAGGNDDLCARVVARILGISIENAYYNLVMSYDR